MLELHSAGENAMMLYLGEETSPDVAARVQAATAAVELAMGDDHGSPGGGTPRSNLPC